MTQEDKQLLLQDLCARLPYGVKGKLRDSNYNAILKGVSYNRLYPLLVRPLECPLTNDDCSLDVDEFKPYLRPMSSMTQEEIDEYDAELDKDLDIMMDGALDKDRHITSDGKHNFSKNFVAHFGNDWLNAHHFDYHGLIEKGLVLEATKGMYNN